MTGSADRGTLRLPLPASSQADLDRIHRRLDWTHTYFDLDRDHHIEQHRSLDTILSTRPIAAGPDPRPLHHAQRELPHRFRLPGCQATYLSVPPIAVELDQFLRHIGTQGLAVWHDGHLVDERYLGDHSAETRWMTNSASKLVVAMLIADAQRSGTISGRDQLLTELWPELAETVWDTVTIGHCMSMTTGVDWVEEDLDMMRDSQFAQFSHEVAFGSIDAFLMSLSRRSPVGTELIYSSMDTEVLGGALIRATGRGIAELVQDTLWLPGGMEHSAYWVSDDHGREMALSGLCATLRDYLRLGLLLLPDTVEASDVIPAGFRQRLNSPDPAIFEMAGHDDYPLVCWDQAFIPCRPDDQRGDFMAAGSYGQIIYVDPPTRTVIAHQGVFADITTEYIDLFRCFMLFRQIAAALS